MDNQPAAGPLPAGQDAEAPAVQAVVEGFNFPLVDPEHDDMQRLLANAMNYLKPEHGLVDPASGYPVEGWNQDPQSGLFLRSFTQLTAIGKRLELLANIAAGHADNPFVSREQAFVQLDAMVSSLLADQSDPVISAKGLLVNFLGFDKAVRVGPLSEEVEKSRFIAAFGAEQAEQIWAALVARKWIVPRQDGTLARIQRQGEYGGQFFTGELEPFADREIRERIMALLDVRVVQIIFGDNANLTASAAKAAGALMRHTIAADPRVTGLRRKLEYFIARQEPGYRALYDKQTGTFFFGWNATHDRHTGWEDGGGQWVTGHMNYFINEFRGPLMFVVQRFDLPLNAIRNNAFKLKPYRMANGRDLYTLASWNGSAFESLGLSLFMGEMDLPGWQENLDNAVAIALDYARRHRLPGILSEAYSGNGVEYTGRIGIPDIAVDRSPRITDAPSLYMLGVAYGIAPEPVERFLEENRERIEGLFTEHGPWEGYNTSRKRAIEYQTTAHTLALILGGIGSADANMQRYRQWKGLPSIATLGGPGAAFDFLGERAQWTAWSAVGDRLEVASKDAGLRIRGQGIRDAAITIKWTGSERVNLSNGVLRLEYRTPRALDVVMSMVNGASGVNQEILARFNAVTGKTAREIRVPLPATPGLADVREVVLRFGQQSAPQALDLSLTGFEFIPAAPAALP